MAEYIPPEILLQIFPRLPADDVLKFRRACKTWQILLTVDKTFAAMHFRLHTNRLHVSGSSEVRTHGLIFLIRTRKNRKGGSSYICHQTSYGEYCDHDVINNTKPWIQDKLRLINHRLQNRWKLTTTSTSLVGSCNGLICFGEPKAGFLICNPITGEYLDLQGCNKIFEACHITAVHSGFGYIPETDEYKVVRILYSSSYGAGFILVYTLGVRSGWKVKKVIDAPLRSPCGVFINGGLHWLGGNGKDIMVFNLLDETFDVLPPVPVWKDHQFGTILGSFGEGLCVSAWETEGRVAIWTYKKTSSMKGCSATNQNGESWSWCKQFTMNLLNSSANRDCTPLAVTKSGFLLFKYKHTDNPGHERNPCPEALLCYDPRTVTNTRLGIWKDFDVIPHTNSFVSLKALGERTCKERNK